MRDLLTRLLKLIIFGVPLSCCILFLVYLRFGWLTSPDFPRGSVIYDGQRNSYSRVLLPRTIDRCIEQQEQQPIESCNPDLSYCDRFFGELGGIRIVTYDLIPWASMRFDGLMISLYFSTSDGGKSWHSFMSSRNFQWKPSCKNVGYLDDNTFWFSFGMFLAFTHDAGKTWQFAYPPMIPISPVGRPDEFENIDVVYFVNDKDGNMIVGNYQSYYHPDETISLHTTDGGQTWQMGSLWETQH